MLTCTEHRDELLLLALRRQLDEEQLDSEERLRLEGEVSRLEAKLQMN